jgi:hypothetical protein
MKLSKKQLRQLIESAMLENEDPFASRIAEQNHAAAGLANELKDHVFAAKQLAEKAQKYGSPSGAFLKQYDDMLNTLYGFMKFLKASK